MTDFFERQLNMIDIENGKRVCFISFKYILVYE